MKAINDFPNYFINEIGEVFSTKFGDLRKLAYNKTTPGYYSVHLCKDLKRHPKGVHRLLAEHYLHNYSIHLWVNHKNGIKTDNRLENLEMVTPRENVMHALQNKLQKTTGTDHYLAKLDWECVHLIRTLKGFEQKQLALIFGVKPSTIYKCIHNMTWKEAYI